jgi:hypothetical protein
LFAGCGGEEESVVKTVTVPDTAPRVVTVVVTPVSAHAVKAGKPLELTALVAGVNNPNNMAVQWSVEGNQSAYTSVYPFPSDDGLQRANLSVGADEAAEKIIVRARSVFTSDTAGDAEITVRETDPAIQDVTVSAPDGLHAGYLYARRGATLLFKAEVIGEEGVSQEVPQEVEWGVLGNKSKETRIDGGLLTVDAEETSPALVVTARSQADGAVSGAALALVSYVSDVTVTPDQAVVERGGERKFTAAVDGRNIPPEMAGVTWSIAGALRQGTAIDPDSGLLAVAADETGTDGKLTVRAVSPYDSAKFDEIDAVIAQVTLVTVSSSGTTAVTKGGQVQFSATITGTDGLSVANQGVVWSVTGAGKTNTAINPDSGLLTVAADETAGSLTVKATSVYDSGKSASMSVTVGGFTVTFYDGNSILTTQAAITNINYGATVSLPSLPTKSGAVAKGWYTAQANGARLSGSTLPITANTNIYVQWLGSGDTGKAPNASGGNEVKYINTTTGFDEAHVFKTNGAFILPATVTGAEVLIVAGGAGGGGPATNSGGDNGGGGGAGGIQYASSITINAGSYNVVVGAGGNGGSWTNGGSGGSDSTFGNVTAKGGGGGGAGNNNTYGTGGSGGSGGGAGAGAGSDTYNGGTYNTTTFSGYTRKGNNGAASNSGTSGGGGGGAESAGTTNGKGGTGFTCSINGGTSYVYSTGGSPGGIDGANTNYGNGGNGGVGGNSTGTAGQPGIVIVRFPYKYSLN